MSNLPPLPSFHLDGIFRCRDALRAVMEPFVGTQLVGPTMHMLADQMRPALPKVVRQYVLADCCRYLLGRPLTADDATQLAWRLAGNVPALKARKPVTPWVAQTTDEWVPFQVTRAQPRRNRRGKLGADITFQALSGSPCPMKITAFWSRELGFMAAARMGFSKPWHDYPYKTLTEFVGLRLAGYVEVSRSVGQPSFFGMECSSTMIEYNRAGVLRRRVRKDPCPFDYKHPCHHCVVGYDQCSAGTHALTFEKGPCDGCGQAEALFDPEQHGPHCVNCTNQELQRKQ